MSVNVGIVIGCNNPAYENCAKVRIPALHGLPLTNSVYTELTTKFKDFISYRTNNIVTDGNNSHDVTQYSITEFNRSDNSKVKSDDEIPWYPIIFPFGHNVGPNLWDIVYVIDDSYVLGWADKYFIPTV